MPNSVGHKSQKEAESEMQQFGPLIHMGCSEALKQFICALYVPMCLPEEPETKLLPCRELCHRAHTGGCVNMMKEFDMMEYKWPESTRCDKLPVAVYGELCYDGN